MSTRSNAPSEDAVLLREFSHRGGNDAAVALAAVRLLEGSRSLDATARSRLIRQTTLRLETSVELNRLLSRPIADRIDAGGWLNAVCGVLGTSADDQPGARLVVDAPDLISRAPPRAGWC